MLWMSGTDSQNSTRSERPAQQRTWHGVAFGLDLPLPFASKKKKAWFSLIQRGVSMLEEYPEDTLLEYQNQPSSGS